MWAGGASPEGGGAGPPTRPALPSVLSTGRGVLALETALCAITKGRAAHDVPVWTRGGKWLRWQDAESLHGVDKPETYSCAWPH